MTFWSFIPADPPGCDPQLAGDVGGSPSLQEAGPTGRPPTGLRRGDLAAESPAESGPSRHGPWSTKLRGF